ncbi:fumarylacetoacetate hydrolase family protein [Gallibacterium sp. AGMB14963]|uniref:fumarylacetoacetate hydrolase family protein n=1 Tax=Gallibacterium faecale TaxID=3019086 RepID=UPI0022F1D0E9|nr:fumarylacetoacetate hydrolase family protein [Gallibacterium sp. AGMB14963]MDA3979671.1 fumarylacetoacetate hydrolase family protein [Gallibacterium sp. AGMB14963]
MSYVFTPPPVAAIPVIESEDLFAVRRIYCVGRNYAAHAREMGHDPDREPPFFFCKPADAIRPVKPGETYAFPYPTITQNLHYEGELVAVIGKAGSNIPVETALEHVWGYAVGLDMTRRDLQNQMKEMGRPWEIGKAFDGSAPIGPIYPVSKVGHITSGVIWLTVNNVEKQHSDISDLIWSVAETIAHLSTLFALEAGDLIFTGTPEGVSKVGPGDKIRLGIDKLGELAIEIV